MAVVGAIKEFYPYLYGFSFRLVTDHNPLTSLCDIKDVGGRLTRWILYLQQFNFTWEHRAGKHHSNADTMSCLPPTNLVLGVFQQLSPNIDSIKTTQRADKILSPVISALSSRSPLPVDVAPALRHAILEEGILCRRFRPSSSTERHLQVVIPDTMKSIVLQQLHNQSGHLGFHKRLRNVFTGLVMKVILPLGLKNAKSARGETNHSQHNKPLWKHLPVTIHSRNYLGTSWAPCQ